MSHFTRIRTQLVEEEYLKKALTDLGFEWEAGDLKIGGFAGQNSQVELRVKLPGSYDIGFRKNGPSYELVADWFGVRNLNRQTFLNQVAQRYAYHAAIAKLSEQGFSLVGEEKESDGRLHLTLRRVA